MPALDINMIESLSRELHPPHTNLMAETEVHINRIIMPLVLSYLVKQSMHKSVALLNLIVRP